MKIYQVIIGELPEYLVACVESVIAYCDRSKNEYIRITEIPEKLSLIPSEPNEYFRNRLIKDWIVLDLLSSEPEIMVVDWDIYLYSNFYFLAQRYPAFATWPMDCMMYNADKILAFDRMKKLAGDVTNTKPGHLLLADVIAKYRNEIRDFRYTNFDNNQYKHIDNCRLMQ